MTDSIPSTASNLERFAGDNKSLAPKPTRLPPASISPSAASGNKPDSKALRLNHLNYKEFEDRMPRVAGFRILLIPVQHEEVTEGGIVLPKKVLDDQLNHAQIFRVIGMGNLAYQDEQRFPEGPYCVLGDYVYIGRYVGTRISTQYCEDLRLVADDEIMAVEPDVASALDLA